MHRMSLLNDTANCGYVARLAREHPADSEAARLGTYFHALVAREVDLGFAPVAPPEGLSPESVDTANAMLKGLLRWWSPPENALVEKELTWRGITGHLDLAWYNKEEEVVEVIDWKTGAHLVPHPDNNLQCHAYGMAGVEAIGMTPRYRTRICYTQSYLDIEALEDPGHWVTSRIWEKSSRGEEVLAAASTPEEPREGPWCLSCWHRVHCPAFCSQALVVAPTMEMSNLAKIVPTVLALEKLVDAAKARMKELIGDGQVDLGNGYVYRGWSTKGRKSVDTAKLKSDGIYDIYAKAGAPFLTWDVRKVKP